MKQYTLPAGTEVTLVSPSREKRKRTLKSETVFFEDDRIGPEHWGFRYVGDGEMGFSLTKGWDAYSQGVLVMKEKDE